METPLLNLLQILKREGQTLTVESADFETHIGPALAEWVFLTASTELNTRAVNALRCLVECTYILGYQRGQREAKSSPMSFVVAPEWPESIPSEAEQDRPRNDPCDPKRA